MPLKDILYKRKLKQRLNSVQKDKVDSVINSCKQIGILFELHEQDTEEQIKQFCQQWSKKGHQISIFHVILNKEKIEEDQVFTQADFNWYGWPNSDKLNTFTEKAFDVLIVLNPRQIKLIETLSILSKARFKIGTNPSQVEHFQLIIDSKDHQNAKNVLKDLNNSLSKIAL